MTTPLVATYNTKDATGNRESISDRIAKVDPIETPLYSMAEKVSIGSRAPEWLEWQIPASVLGNPQQRGQWTDGASYLIGDVVFNDGADDPLGYYTAITNHTADDTLVTGNEPGVDGNLSATDWGAAASFPSGGKWDKASEGQEFTDPQLGGDFNAPTNPTRYQNACQLVTRSFAISGTLQAINLAGGNAIEAQTMNFGLEARRAVEQLLNANQLGNAAEPRSNAGLPTWADGGDGTTLNTSTVTHVADDVEDGMIALFGAGVRADVLLQSPANKKLFSASTKTGTANTGFQIESAITDRKTADIAGAVSVYLSDMGVISCVVSQFTDATLGASFLFDSRKIQVGQIKDRAFSVERLGKSGDAHQIMILWEGALMAMSPKSILTVV